MDPLKAITESLPSSPPIIENTKLIHELLHSEEAISKSFPNTKTTNSTVGTASNSKLSKPSKSDRYFSMISNDRIEYAITDLITRHNQRHSPSDIVAEIDIKKLIRKWRGNLVTLYNRLLDRYQCRESEGAEVVEHNVATQRMSGCYRLGAQLGRGAFAVVLDAERISDGRMFAAKMVKKRGLSRWDLRGLRLEISILKKVRSRNLYIVVL